MKKSDNLNIITCPHCGMEYLPAEIFVDRAFFGRPTDIERDVQGKIMTFQGKTLDVNEEYKCDGCHKSFKVNTRIKFKSFVDEDNEFDTEYVSPLKTKKLILFED